MRTIPRAVGLVVVVLLVAAACGADEDSAAGNGANLAGRTFLSVSVTEDGHERAFVGDGVIRLEFTDTEVRARIDCNHLFGEIESTSGGVLVVGSMGSTEMGCDPERHAQDAWLVDVLSGSPTWDLDGERLVVTAGSTVLDLLDRRIADPDRSLEGTRWTVDTIVQGETAMSTPGDAVAELTLVDGQLTGFTGCNQLSGEYRIDDGRIHFDTFVQTDVACDSEVMVLEDAVLALSGVSVEFEITAGSLILTAPDGRGLGLHADT